jgi:acetate---CoA ligase (ADP-forming)
MATEVLRSSAGPRIHFVHPKYTFVRDRPCVPSLAELEEQVDLVLLGVPDSALPEQLALAAERGDGAAVVFGSAHGLGDELRTIARAAGMAMCGGGSMGFVNPARGIRAIGYVERDRLPAGGVAMVTHSGSVFSALLRTHRALDYALAVSSGQELVTSMAEYVDHALGMEETRVVGLFAETLRDADGMQRALARAAEQGVPVVALTVGGSPTGRQLVAAHSGAIAGDDAAWEALFTAYGVHRVNTLDELVDTLEMFAIGRRVRPDTPRERLGIATVHDSGGERALVADRADALGVPFTALTEATNKVLTPLLDAGLEPTNPLDVWGRGADTETLFAACLEALVEDPGVAVVAAGLDLVEEYDGDMSYPRAIRTIHARTDKPVVVLSNIANSVDHRQAERLRAAGIPVLAGTDSGLRALGHLLAQAVPVAPRPILELDRARAERWRTRIAAGLAPAEALSLLADYGITVAETVEADTRDGAAESAERCGYPVVLKTAADGVHHKTDVGGVRRDLVSAEDVSAAYVDLADRLGPKVVVQHQVPAGVEVALGIVRDPLLGPLVVVATGGTLIEVMPQRAVGLPPLSRAAAHDLVTGLAGLAAMLSGVRGAAASDIEAVVDAVVAMSQLAFELGDVVEAVDVNPLVCSSAGAVAVDALVLPR